MSTQTNKEELHARQEAAIDRFREKMAFYKRNGLSVCASSSFQSHSLALLHLIGRIAPETPVYFLDTGFHFPETIRFKNEIAASFGINVVDVRSAVSKIDQRDSRGNFYFTSDPDRCCYLNKVQPMENMMREHDIWISGLRRDQNSNRASFQEEMDGKFNCRRYHPMLDWDKRMIWDYITRNELPQHPLEEKGYLTVGCEPCTRVYLAVDDADDRDNRWAGLQKTECGLHTELVQK